MSVALGFIRVRFRPADSWITGGVNQGNGRSGETRGLEEGCYP